MTDINKWWYPDKFWIEAMKIIAFGTIIQLALILLIGVPNLIFKLSWVQYISWTFVLNYLACNIFVLLILIKGLWSKLKNE
jgi:hypothetical protein